MVIMKHVFIQSQLKYDSNNIYLPFFFFFSNNIQWVLPHCYLIVLYLPGVERVLSHNIVAIQCRTTHSTIAMQYASGHKKMCALQMCVPIVLFAYIYIESLNIINFQIINVHSKHKCTNQQILYIVRLYTYNLRYIFVQSRKLATIKIAFG